jgi:hypothetical protein
MMFVVRIVKWDMINSAIGTIEGTLGNSSDVGVRTEALCENMCCLNPLEDRLTAEVIDYAVKSC